MLKKVPDRAELKKMKPQELNALASDIREFLVDAVSKKGGHLASNLGAVELTIALYSVFDPPKDKLIFDVGHQAYTHKLLSGRMEAFSTLRDFGGLSGFPKMHESDCDAFGTGHSSTSISAGLGICRARDLKGEKFHVVSVIGDGSMTGGLAFEALNNVAQMKSNFIIILNDNEMSISKNVGGLSRFLNTFRSGAGYNKLKRGVKSTLGKIPYIGEELVERIADSKDSLKEIMVPEGMVFENMGITYLGPVDGHDIVSMKQLFRRAKKLDRCVIIHVRTKKGKGYPPAERRPVHFHGVGPFDKASGRPLKKKNGPDYSDLFGRFMTSYGETDPRLVAITAAMTENVGLTTFRKRFPERFFDVGIAEQHAVTFAAGLASQGMHPVAAIYSTFLQRAYDEIVHDVCLQNLPVTFAIDRAGIVGKDGETHQGIFDLAYLLSIPNMTVLTPSDGDELTAMLRFALKSGRPAAVRYPRGEALPGRKDAAALEYGKAEVLHTGKDVALLAFGNMLKPATEAAEKLRETGVDATVVNMRFAKPLDLELVSSLTEDHRLIVTLEDGLISGGAGERIAAFIAEKAAGTRVVTVGVPDTYVPQGEPAELYRLYGMDADGIVSRVAEALKEGTL